MTVHRWYSPRKTVQLLESIRRDPLKVMVDNRGDIFAEFVIDFVQQQIATTKRSSHEVLDFHIADIRGAIPRGAPDEEARAIFFETIVIMTEKYIGNLALPPRDERNKTSTPLYEFANEMTDLVVDYGNAMLTEKKHPLGRFDGFARLDRKRLIRRLELPAGRFLVRNQ
jgi:hypothetical protein